MSTEQQDRTVQFLRDQEALYGVAEGVFDEASFVPKEIADAVLQMCDSPQIFEPVVMTRRERITFGGPGIRIDSFVKLEGGLGLHIGKGVHIASFAHIGIGGGETLIGDYACVASGGRVISGSNQPEAPSMSASAPKELQLVKASRTVLCAYSAVLTNAIVMPGVRLEEGAVLAANSLARQDIPAWEIWGGSPARFLRRRREVICCKHRTASHREHPGVVRCVECEVIDGDGRYYEHALRLAEFSK